MKQKGNNSQNQCRKYGIYLPINQSPTSDAVVAETLARTQNVAEECGKRTISLPMTQLQLRRQCKSGLQKNPNIAMYYKSWFIPTGLEFFKVFGKYID